MYPFPRRLIRHDRRVARVRRLAFEFERTIDRCLEVICRLKSAAAFLHEQEAWMSVSQIKFPTRRKDGRDDPGPNHEVPQPADRSPRNKDQVEGPRHQPWRLVYSALHEFSLQAGLLCEAARDPQSFA